MRGHADQNSGSSRLGTSEIDDLLELIDQVHSERPAPVILYGFSMGAGISICAATRDERVVGVIADGPYRWTAEPIRSLLEHNRIPPWFITPIGHRVICRLIPELNGSDRARFAAMLKCPMMVLHGTEDPFCSINSSMEIAEAAPEADFIVMPNAAHLDLHINHANRYKETIHDFIRKCMKRARRATDPPPPLAKS